jgi:hypothetical protein
MTEPSCPGCSKYYRSWEKLIWLACETKAGNSHGGNLLDNLALDSVGEGQTASEPVFHRPTPGEDFPRIQALSLPGFASADPSVQRAWHASAERRPSKCL